MRLSELKFKGDNPRTIKDEKFTKLVNSIKEFPKMLELRPMIYDPATMEVLGGNMRLRALKKLGYREIPDNWVKAASELTDEEKSRFCIVDNVGFGEWDYEMIANNWDTQELSTWGFDMPEFEAEKIPAAKEDNYEIPEEIKTNIVVGDLFEIGEHRLLCGDATKAEDYKKLYGNKEADNGTHRPALQCKLRRSDKGQAHNYKRQYERLKLLPVPARLFHCPEPVLKKKEVAGIFGIQIQKALISEAQ